MSNDLEKRIALLERKLKREKSARQQSESQLEGYSRKIYFTNQSLEEALQKEKKRASELEYLAASSAIANSDIKLSQLIVEYIELTCQLCKAKAAIYVFTEQSKELPLPNNKIWLNEQGWQVAPKYRETIINELPISEIEEFNQWMVTPIELKLFEQHPPLQWLYFLNIELSGSTLGWIAILSDSNFVDEEILYVLGTAQGHLSSGIKRRMMEVRILKRNRQLQATIDQLEVAQSQLIRSEKMAVLGQLSAGIAHEMNNPLGYIKSNIEVLNDYWQSLSDWQEQLISDISTGNPIDISTFKQTLEEIDYEFIKEDTEELMRGTLEGVQRVRDIVLDLRTFCHQGEETFTDTNVNECIENAIKIANSSKPFNCDVSIQLAATQPIISGNAGQLQQVFINFFVNAYHAMQEQGGTLNIVTLNQDKQVSIKIADNGCGMSDDTLKKLFTPFFTTKPVGVGTGLGLSISYAIIESHNGTIVTESELGKGTTFTININKNQN